jgi:lysophospholipase L1-like esterase
MNRFLISILLLAAFSLLPVNGQPDNRNLDVVFIGNSITQGVQLENPNESAPPAFATAHLRTLGGISSANFLNRGRSGYTTINFLPWGEGEFSRVVASTREFHKDNTRLLVFSVSLGTNDSAEEGPRGAPLSPEQYILNIKAITDQLLIDFPESRVVLQQPIWYSPTTYNRSRYLSAGLARLQSYFPELKKLVSIYSQTNPGHVLMGDTKAFDYFKANYLTDLIPESGNAGTFYLHPNKKGAEALGKFWAEGIYNSLAK